MCLFLLLAIYLSIYVMMLPEVLPYVYKESHWRQTSPPGSFFPFPRKPGLADAIVPMSPLDWFIYTFFIRTYLIYLILLLSWGTTIELTIKIAKTLVKEKQQEVNYSK